MRTLLTPLVTGTTRDLAQGLVYRKQILPLDSVQYEGRTLSFDDRYFDSLVQSFTESPDPIPFVLADAQNRHSMDPELVRGEVTSISLANPDEEPGLYATISFPTPQAAKAVLTNPKLGVSCRIVEEPGKKGMKKLIHVCGTLIPRVKGMSPWRKTDLTGYDARSQLVDLTDSDWSKQVAKQTTTIDPENMTPEQIREWVANLSDDDLETLYQDAVEVGGEGEGDETDEGDEGGDETDEGDGDAGDGETNLTTAHQRAIDLAQATATAAQARADEALRRAADAEWKERRTGLLLAGVPAADLDLCEPILNRPFPMVIDLSGGGEDDINVTDIVTKLLDARKGTIDLSVENGHGGLQAGEKDPDEENLALWDAQYGSH